MFVGYIITTIHIWFNFITKTEKSYLFTTETQKD